MRIDVNYTAAQIDDELAALQHRLRDQATQLQPVRHTARLPGFAARFRCTDGSVFVYVEDLAQRRLAGYTVFRRLDGLDRRSRGAVLSPHSKFAPAYQRRGLASHVYGWMLDGGVCLVSGARQSPAAHALWRSIGRRRHLGFVRCSRRSLRYLGADAPPDAFDDLDTRMVLWGDDWCAERFDRLAPPRGRPALQGRGPSMVSTRTQASNCSAPTRPDAIAASRRLDPSRCAALAISAARS